MGFLLGRRLAPGRGRITSGDTGQRATPPAGSDVQGLPAVAEETSPASREGGEETPTSFTEEAPTLRYEVPDGPEEARRRLLRARLERDPRTRNLRYLEVRVVEGGVAEVRGFARSSEQKSAVEEVIRGAEDVGEVRNLVEIRRVL